MQSRQKEEAPKPVEREKPEVLAFVPKERPMSLSQMSHMAPKRFKQNKKLSINLSEVKHLIDRAKEKINDQNKS
jgi:hypothetical protein